MAVCKYCSKEIVWIKEGHKNVSINFDGSKHKCEEMEKSRQSFKYLGRDALSEEEIKRYEQSINSINKKK